MSKIKNSGLDHYGTKPFKQQQYGRADVEGVNFDVCGTARHLLGDVPHESGRVESHQPVVDGDLVKRGALLVAEERVRNPDLVPVIFAETNGVNFGMDGLKSEPPIAPRLPQIHADGVVLQRQRHR